MRPPETSPKPAGAAALHARTLVERARRRAAAAAATAAAVRDRLRNALAEVAPALGIERAILFGSLAWGDFDPARSDVDLLVWGLAPGTAIETACAIEDLVGRPVHVVRAESAPPALSARAERAGLVVHVA